MEKELPENIPGYAAELYDKLARDAINSYYKRVAAEVTAVLTSGRLLDIGTGPGYLVIEIAKIRPEIKIVAIDLTPELIEIAKRNVDEANVSGLVNLEVGDAYRLRFGDERYDLVISTGVLHSLKDPIKALNEWHRVLKPGAEAWIYDPALILTKGKSEEWRRKLTEKELAIFELYNSQVGTPPRTYTVEEAREIVRKTKFTEHDIRMEEYLKIKLRKVNEVINRRI
jgi:ubiquinone/menaquinone biosynthesis C-methylase UbiE